MKLLEEFKAFALKGNVVDMAVGVIIGGAFGKIVTSLVNDIIMPPLGVLIGGMDFKNLTVVIREAATDPTTGQAVAAVTLNYGNFIQTTVDFLIIAFSIFMAVKVMNRLKRKKEAAPAPQPPAPSTEQSLLTDIRDILRRLEEKN